MNSGLIRLSSEAGRMDRRSQPRSRVSVMERFSSVPWFTYRFSNSSANLAYRRSVGERAASPRMDISSLFSLPVA